MNVRWTIMKLCCLLVAVCAETIVNSADLQIKHVVILMRHALRAPLEFHPDVISNISLYPMGAGFLTSVGKRQAFKAGRIFRQMYHNLLSDDPREVWARSSSSKRCFETVSLMLATMYPPRGVFSWNETLDWQPIQIQNVPPGHDRFIVNCNTPFKPDYLDIFDEKGPPGFPNVGDFVRYVTEQTGFSADESTFYVPVIDALLVHKWNKFLLPRWARNIWPDIVWAVPKLSFERQKRQMPFFGSNIMQAIADRLMLVTSGKDNGTKISLFGYHDTNFQGLFSSLQMDHVKYFPFFMGSLHFRLLQDTTTKTYFVETFFSSGFNEDEHYNSPTQIVLPGCSKACEVETMVNILQTAYPEGTPDYTNCTKTLL